MQTVLVIGQISGSFNSSGETIPQPQPTNTMKARKPISHGHSGNRKNWIVSFRPPAHERAERIALGIPVSWSTSPPVTQKAAFEFAAKCELHGDEVTVRSI